MDGRLTFRVEGEDREAAARELEALVKGFDAAAEVEVRPVDEAGEEGRRADPLAIAALVLSIPGAVLAVMDIADRIAERRKKRRRAEELLGRAKQISVTHRVEIRIIASDGPRDLVRLSADQLLEYAGRVAGPRPRS